jgi:hypothetical protein
VVLVGEHQHVATIRVPAGSLRYDGQLVATGGVRAEVDHDQPIRLRHRQVGAVGRQRSNPELDLPGPTAVGVLERLDLDQVLLAPETVLAKDVDRPAFVVLDGRQCPSDRVSRQGRRPAGRVEPPR